MLNLEQVLKPKNIQQALEYLLTEKNICGDDGIFLHELETYWEMHQETITKQLLQFEYYPQLIHNRMTITP